MLLLNQFIFDELVRVHYLLFALHYLYVFLKFFRNLSFIFCYCRLVLHMAYAYYAHHLAIIN